MWQLETQLFASSCSWLGYIFEVSYSRVVTSWAKDQVLANQNSRNRWCLIVRRAICILEQTRALTSASHGKFWTADWKAVIVNLKPSPNMACCGCWWLGLQCFTSFPYDSPMVPPWFPHVSPMILQLFLWVPGWFPVGSPRFPFLILRSDGITLTPGLPVNWKPLLLQWPSFFHSLITACYLFPNASCCAAPLVLSSCLCFLMHLFWLGTTTDTYFLFRYNYIFIIRNFFWWWWRF